MIVPPVRISRLIALSQSRWPNDDEHLYVFHMGPVDVGSWLNLLDVLQIAGSDYCAQTLVIAR